MFLYRTGLLATLLVLHRSLAFLNTDLGTDLETVDPDPGKPFQLTVSPAQVNRYTTETMTLRCERNPKVNTDIDQIVTMKIVKQSKTGWSLVAEQRVAEDSPRVEGNFTASSDVAGDISDVFLQVTWDGVERENFGKYMCEVLGADANYNVVKEKSLEIDIYEAKIPVDYFVDLSKKTHNMVLDLKETMNAEIPSLKKELEGIEKSTEGKFTSLDDKVTSTKARLTALDDQGTETKKELITLDEEVTSTKKRLATLETLFGGLTKWPGGFYGLLQPKTGCPVDLAFFGGTHKFTKIHTETQSNDDHSQAFSSHTSSAADGKDFINLEFCEVTQQFNTARWPRGSFCINHIIHQECPRGFSPGFVGLDTDDYDAASETRTNVADGSSSHVYLHFCCQNTGSLTVPIKLPTSSPFLLYRYRGECQPVQGMRVSEEYIRFDTEDTGNGDSLFNTHPDVDMSGTAITLHLCYYTKK